jgi:regulator of sirC expression with transglutaminase-like and TPR domain
MATASLQHLPSPLLGVILSYVPDPETICNVAATCKDFRAATRDAALWERLHRHRWVACPSPEDCLTMADYQQRHQLDASALKCIDSLQTSANHLVMLYAVTHIMSSGGKVVDSLCKVWKENSKQDHHDTTASSLVHLLHYLSVCESLMELLANDSNKEGHQDADERQFEECAILTSKMFFPLDKDNLGADTDESQSIRDQLDQIAQTIQSQFRSPHMHLEDKLSVVHKILFTEMKFSTATHNEDDDDDDDSREQNHHHGDNSLLHTALKQRQDVSPLILAILYKCICRRVGIQVEIVGLPGDNLVCLPQLNNRNLVDVCDHGRLLTFHDCELRFQETHRIPIMASTALKPKSTQLVVQRVLKNIDDGFGQSLSSSEHRATTTTTRTIRPTGDDAMKRAVLTALRALACSPDKERMESCRRLLGLTWVTQFVGAKVMATEKEKLAILDV